MKRSSQLWPWALTACCAVAAGCSSVDAQTASTEEVPYKVQVSAARDLVKEGALASVQVSVDPVSCVDVEVELAYGGSATAFKDYTPITSVTIPAGQGYAEVPLVTVDDGFFEGDEDILVSIIDNSAALAVGGPTRVRLQESTPSGLGEGSPWGVASSSQSSADPAWFEPVAAAKVAWVRGYNRSDMEATLTAAGQAGLQVTGVLQVGSTFPAEDLTTWEAHVAEALELAKGRIRHWEIWNEPPNYSDSKSPEEYAAIVTSAYDLIKAHDPTLQVGLCAASTYLTFMDQALVAGAADHFDFIALHPYESLDRATDGAEAMYLSTVPAVRAMLRARNPAKEHVPVIFTEVGQPVDASVSEEEQADALVKAYVLGLAQGVTRIHWFEGKDGDSGDFGLISSGNYPRLAYFALTHLIHGLGEQPALNYLGWTLLNGVDYAFVFEGPQGPVAVAWARPGTQTLVDFGQRVTELTPATGLTEQVRFAALTDSPRLFHHIPQELVAEARANRGQPFPWDGDYSEATEIAVVAGESDAGLHLASTRPAVQTYSGTAGYDMRSAASHRFAVDPNFMLYDSEPIRVTAVVRFNGDAEAGDTAGFKLGYEAVGAWMKSASGWTTVPTDGEWHTFVWDIDDAQFVGRWGYNLQLNSDSEQYSNYELQSLTVVKRGAETAE